MSQPIDISADAYEGYIFDMDGTVVDSMPLHFQAWTETVTRKSGEEPCRFTEEMFYNFAGRPPREIVGSLNDDHGCNLPVEETVTEKEARFLELLHHVEPIPVVVDFIKILSPNVPKAIASGGCTDIVEQTLRETGLRDYFSIVIGSDQVSKGKPSPELFLKAAAALGVNPQRCVVFEDGPSGFAAARAAGMTPFDVRPFYMTPERWKIMREIAPE